MPKTKGVGVQPTQPACCVNGGAFDTGAAVAAESQLLLVLDMISGLQNHVNSVDARLAALEATVANQASSVPSSPSPTVHFADLRNDHDLEDGTGAESCLEQLERRPEQPHILHATEVTVTPLSSMGSTRGHDHALRHDHPPKPRSRWNRGVGCHMAQLKPHLPTTQEESEADFAAAADPTDSHSTTVSPSKRMSFVEEVDLLDYQLGTTLWDAPAFIGLSDMGHGITSIVLFCTLLNALAQLYLVYVLLDSDSFILKDKWTMLEASTKRWRNNEAHQYSQIDAAGTSLAARVCGLDGDALSVAASQSGMLAEINTYVGLEGASMEASKFQTGPWLCTVCVFMWIVAVVKEMRQLATYLMAVFSTPRGRTQLEDDKIVAMSCLRVLGILCMALVRFVVAVALLYAGVMWLSHTSSTTDLILNAAALNFVMDLDELLLETAVPAVVHRFLAELKPLQYKSPVFYVEAIVPILLMLSVTFVSASQLIFPNVDAMLAVKREMCSGLIDFAVSQNGAGFAVALLTKPFRQSYEPTGVREKAVKELRMRNQEKSLKASEVYSDFAFVPQTTDSFTSFHAINLETYAGFGVCVDKDVLAGGVRKEQKKFWFTTVTAETQKDTSLHYNASAWHCRDYAKYCDTFALVRAVCPVTCGCDNPTSGQIYNHAQAGVPVACLKGIDTTPGPNQTCTDMEVHGNPSWVRFWQSYRLAVINKFPNQEGNPGYEEFIRNKIANGCNDTTPDPVMGHGFCNDDAAWLTANRIRSVRQFCLRSCCLADPPGADHPECPRSCKA